MDVIEFIKERNRMCNYYKSKGHCKDKSCPASYHCCLDFLSVEYDGFKLVDDVEKFSSEHPQKTMLQDFLEKFPNAPLQSDGTPSLCPYKCGYTREDYCKKFNPHPAYKTCLECWNRPLEG